jgi:hypothetical protein
MAAFQWAHDSEVQQPLFQLKRRRRAIAISSFDCLWEKFYIFEFYKILILKFIKNASPSNLLGITAISKP